MTGNPFRQALEQKDRDGGWSRSGMMYDDGKGCLVANLSRVFPLDAGEAYTEAFEVLEGVCNDQIGFPTREGSIVAAHNRLPGDDLDRIMEKCAVAWDERI